ncbi:MAG: ABC transporter ATP-binding protein [Lentisphaeria bacterium]|nr:ABC transporter ATP-binding protein [Lentisphaeria bacterium]NQZ67015.1 ABC transporter ATP-binding protein [Lentisphaeria bacterium]
MIKTENITKNFGGGRGILGLDLEIEQNTIFGFVGPNGSGKTTTIKILCGLIIADEGRAWIDGMEVKGSNHIKIKKTIGYLPDEFGVYQQMSVWEYLDFFGAAYKIAPKPRKKRIEEVLEVTDASHMMDYQVSSLSRGMHQKIGIAKTMLHDPKILILDEPANGLDPHARIDMRNTILRLKDMGKTIMLSSHILPELGAICDTVGIIEKGKLLIQGTVQDITRSLQQNIVLELNLDSDPEEAKAALDEFENIQKIEITGKHELRIDYLGKRNEIADITSHLVNKSVRVISIRESEIDLENVFLTVTGKSGSENRGTAAKPVEAE